MSKKIVLVLKHKRKDDLAELVFKKNLRFAGKLARYLKNWKLVEVKGDDDDPLVIYMRKQLQDHATPSRLYNLDRKEMFDVVGAEVGGSVMQVKDSFNLLPNSIRRKILGDPKE